MSNSDDHLYVQIKDFKPGMKNINSKFIVLEVGPPTTTKLAHVVRTVLVADASACVNLAVWNEPGALLQPGDILRLTHGYVAFRQSCLTLYCGKAGDIQKVGEFTMLFNEDINMSQPQLFPMAPSNDHSNDGTGQTGSSHDAQNVQEAQHITKQERNTSESPDNHHMPNKRRGVFRRSFPRNTKLTYEEGVGPMRRGRRTFMS